MVERALAPSREKAKAYIMAGNVYVDGQKEDKAGTMFQETVKIEVRGNTLPYVSRGGLKLEKAMNNFGVSLDGRCAWMWEHLPVDLQTVCFRTGLSRFIPSMWDMDSLTGDCEMIRELSVWKNKYSLCSFGGHSGGTTVFFHRCFFLFR